MINFTVSIFRTKMSALGVKDSITYSTSSKPLGALYTNKPLFLYSFMSCPTPALICHADILKAIFNLTGLPYCGQEINSGAAPCTGSEELL